MVNIYRRSEVQITVQDENTNAQKKFTEDAVFYTEPGFFSMFNFEWLAGDPKSTLTHPNNVALTEEVAEKYFGKWQSALGQNITQDNKYVFRVSGILKNVPLNTDFPLSLVVSYPTLQKMGVGRNLNDWVSTSSGAYTLVVLPPGYSPVTFNRNLRTFTKKHRPRIMPRMHLWPNL